MTKGKDRVYKPGERIPGTIWIVVRLLAMGGQGALYLVRHDFLRDKRMCLKTLRSIEPSGHMVERFEREMQVLAGLRHPNVIKVDDGRVTEGVPWFVMEYLRGCSLAEAMQDAPYGVGTDTALQVLIEVCSALAYIHERGITHRDIKPDNIYLQRLDPGPGSITKLLDFGISHRHDPTDGKRLTREDSILGTLEYMAPESLRSASPPLPQTDIYSLGVVAYQIVTGRHPFEHCAAGLSGKHAIFAITKAHLEVEPPPFPPFPIAPCPEGLEEIILHMLRKEPEDRPRSAEWLGTQLTQILRLSRVVSADVQPNQTHPSPAQNALTATRGEATDPGPALGEQGDSEKTDPSFAAGAGRSSGDTLRDAGKGATVRLPLPADPNPTVRDGPLPFVATNPSPDPYAATAASTRPPRNGEVRRWTTTEDPDAPVQVAARSPSAPIAASPHAVERSGPYGTEPLPPPGVGHDVRRSFGGTVPLLAIRGEGNHPSDSEPPSDKIYRDSDLRDSERPPPQSLTPRGSAAPLVASPRPARAALIPAATRPSTPPAGISARNSAPRLSPVTTSNGVTFDRLWPGPIRITRAQLAAFVGAVATILLLMAAARFATRASATAPTDVAGAVPSPSPAPAPRPPVASSATQMAPPAPTPAASPAVVVSPELGAPDRPRAAVAPATPPPAPRSPHPAEKDDMMRDDEPWPKTSQSGQGPIGDPSAAPRPAQSPPQPAPKHPGSGL